MALMKVATARAPMGRAGQMLLAVSADGI